MSHPFWLSHKAVFLPAWQISGAPSSFPWGIPGTNDRMVDCQWQNEGTNPPFLTLTPCPPFPPKMYLFTSQAPQNTLHCTLLK